MGNTIVDAIKDMLPKVKLRSKEVLAKLSLKKSQYIFVTLHRQENVDNPMILTNILEQLAQIKNQLGMDIVFAIHPRTKKRIKQYKLSNLTK